LLRSRGSAPVDFVLISAPLVLMAVSILGVAVNSYGANIAQDVAVEAARFASLADTTTAEAELRAIDQLKSALGDSVDVEVSVSRLPKPCESLATVRLQSIPLGIIGSGLKIEESAIEICELQI
jgi:hypothetical protein